MKPRDVWPMLVLFFAVCVLVAAIIIVTLHR